MIHTRFRVMVTVGLVWRKMGSWESPRSLQRHLNALFLNLGGQYLPVHYIFSVPFCMFDIQYLIYFIFVSS